MSCFSLFLCFRPVPDTPGRQEGPTDTPSTDHVASSPPCDFPLQPDVGRSQCPTVVLIGPSGSLKSCTANQLVGLENPAFNLQGEGLRRAQCDQLFRTTHFSDEQGVTCTTACSSTWGQYLHVVDTPSFEDSDARADDARRSEHNRRNALNILKYLRVINCVIGAFVLFLPNPLLTYSSPSLQSMLKLLLLTFGNAQGVIDHLIVAQPFFQHIDVQSKAELAKRSRKVVANTLQRLLLEDEELVDAGMDHCEVPSELPFALYCPFPASDGVGQQRGLSPEVRRCWHKPS